MNTPVPGPPGEDPDAVRAAVDAALGDDLDEVGAARLDAADLAEHAGSLDALHRRLAAALDTLDRV